MIVGGVYPAAYYVTGSSPATTPPVQLFITDRGVARYATTDRSGPRQLVEDRSRVKLEGKDTA